LYSYNEEVLDLYSSKNIISVLKSSKRSWTGHVTQIREKRNGYGISAVKPKGKCMKTLTCDAEV